MAYQQIENQQRRTAVLLANHLASVNLDWQNIDPSMAGLGREAEPGVQIYLADRNGQPPAGLTGALLAPQVLGALQSGQTGSFRDVKLGKLTGYAPIAGSGGLFVIVQSPNPEVGLQLPGSTGVGLVMVCLAAAALWVWIVWSVVGKPLRAMATAAAAVDGKSSGLALDTSGMVEEFQLLTSRFNQLCERRKRLVDGYEERVAELQQAQAALQESESRFRLLAETATEMISRQTPEGIYLYVSPSCFSLLGFLPDEMEGHSYYEFFHPEEFEKVSSAHNTVLEKPVTIITSCRMRRKDGLNIWVETASHSLFDEDTGQAYQIHTSSRDVTLRKEAEMRLEESEARMRMVVSNVPIILFAINNAGIIMFSEGKGLNRLGLDPVEIVGQSIFALFHDSSDILYSVRKALIGEENSAQVDLQGRIFDVLYSPNFTSDGIVKGVTGVGMDITERRGMEEAIEQSEVNLTAMIESTDDLIWSVDRDHHLIKFNNAFRRLFQQGFGLQIEAGQRLEDLLPAEQSGVWSQFYSELNGGKRLRVEHKISEQQFLELTLNTIVKDGYASGISIFGKDITERKLAEARIRQELKKLDSLRTIDIAISNGLDVDSILNMVLETVFQHLDVDAADVLLLDRSRQMLVYKAGNGFQTRIIESAQLPHGVGLAWRAISSGEKITYPSERWINDISFSGLLEREGFLAYLGLPLIAKGKPKGVLEVFHRRKVQNSQEHLDYLDLVAGQAAIAIENNELFHDLQSTNQELVRSYEETIKGWSQALELKHEMTRGHSEHVVRLALALAREMGFSGDDLNQFKYGAFLHDIGKMGVPDRILKKPDSLNPEEWATMRRHPEFALHILRDIPYLKNAIDIPYCHHEKWNGTGYPRRLVGREIPLSARIFAVADVYDALTEDRDYRPAWTRGDALEYIRQQAGTHFDPHVVDIFMRVMQQNSIGL